MSLNFHIVPPAGRVFYIFVTFVKYAFILFVFIFIDLFATICFPSIMEELLYLNIFGFGVFLHSQS